MLALGKKYRRVCCRYTLVSYEPARVGIHGTGRAENDENCGSRGGLALCEAFACAVACEVGRAGGIMALSQGRKHSIQGGKGLL